MITKNINLLKRNPTKNYINIDDLSITSKFLLGKYASLLMTKRNIFKFLFKLIIKLKLFKKYKKEEIRRYRERMRRGGRVAHLLPI